MIVSHTVKHHTSPPPLSTKALKSPPAGLVSPRSVCHAFGAVRALP